MKKVLAPEVKHKKSYKHMLILKLIQDFWLIKIYN